MMGMMTTLIGRAHKAANAPLQATTTTNPISQTTSNTSISSTSYLPTLDGWRSIAIALVLFAHASESIFQTMPSVGISDFAALKKVGLIGVQLFFGLSGFLITSKLLEEELHHGQISLRSFYIRRSWRILPAALFFLLVVGLLAATGLLDISLGRWLSTVFFMANYATAEHSWYVGHFWSLAVEEHFYLVWPVAFYALRLGQSKLRQSSVAQRRLALVVSLALVVALWRALDFKLHITGATAATFWGRTDIQVDGILWGVALALLYADPVWKHRLQQFFAAPLSWPALGMTLLVLEALPDTNWKLSFLLITVKAILIPLLVLGTVIHSRRWMGRILETAPLRWLGRLSYSLYLWQQLFLVWAEDRVAGLGVLQSFPLNLIAVFVCATISMVLIERPLIAVGQRIAKTMRRA